MDDLERAVAPLDAASARRLFERWADRISQAVANRQVDGVIDLDSLCAGALRLVRGDLTVDSLHLPAQGPSLFVDGRLTVTGLLEQEQRAGALVVFGDLEAGSIVTTAQIFVAGDLTVADTLFGNCTNYATTVLGRASGKLLVSAKEHLFSCYRGLRFERIVDCSQDTPNLDDRTDGAEALADDLDGGFDQRAAATRLRAGLSLLR